MSLRAWIAIVIWTFIILMLNLATDPGVGAKAPPGPAFELERYFGWPAVYRAELWDSDDPQMASRSRGDFRFYDPTGEMNFRSRYFGWSAVIVDAVFAASILAALVIFGRADRRGRLKRTEIIGLMVCALLLVVSYILADDLSVHL